MFHVERGNLMIKPKDLDEALSTHEALKELDIFIKGLADWHGVIGLSFGSYTCEIATVGAHVLLHEVLTMERRHSLDRLRFLGVDIDAAE